MCVLLHGTVNAEGFHLLGGITIGRISFLLCLDELLRQVIDPLRQLDAVVIDESQLLANDAAAIFQRLQLDVEAGLLLPLPETRTL